MRDGATTTVDVATTMVAAQLEQVVTSATGKPDKVVDAPADVSIVTQEAIATRPSLTIADHIKGVPGVDVSTGGIVQSNIVTRGFNNAFSGTLLTLQDYRFATVPSLRVNVPFLFTSINEDIERIEMVLGPAAALYGPNSSSGVMHIVTRSPFDSPGTTLTLDGGSRAIARGSVRNAGIINPKVAYKISGRGHARRRLALQRSGRADHADAQRPAGEARLRRQSLRDRSATRRAAHRGHGAHHDLRSHARR